MDLNSKCKSIILGELTICHETNLYNSKTYKRAKYSKIKVDCNVHCIDHDVNLFTWELTSLGFLADPTDFLALFPSKILPDSVYGQLVKSVIGNSYKVYRNRNNT